MIGARAPVAQRTEQPPSKRPVAGSIPAGRAHAVLTGIDCSSWKHTADPTGRPRPRVPLQDQRACNARRTAAGTVTAWRPAAA